MINKRAAKATAVNLLRGVPIMIGVFIAGCLGAMLLFAVCYFVTYFLGTWSLVLLCAMPLIIAVVSLVKDLVEYIKLDYQQNVERFKDE